MSVNVKTYHKFLLISYLCRCTRCCVVDYFFGARLLYSLSVRVAAAIGCVICDDNNYLDTNVVTVAGYQMADCQYNLFVSVTYLFNLYVKILFHM